ncbi:MAG: exopolysaccharide biosynthesis polyprenyl glycosylphosphotransferase [Lachnospiraceae bacterium]|nr:exopolysaccharide biosynthesis polyprenyl glycosylphosphotransferase [Lachnospiraceae bacterium]
MKAKSPLFHDITTKIAKVINLALMTFPFIYVWYTFYADRLWVRFEMRGHWLVIGLYMFLYIVIGRTYDAFRLSYNSVGEMVYSQILSLLEVNVIIYAVAWLLIRHLPNPLPILGLFALQICLSVIWCFWVQQWYYRTFPANKTVIIKDMREDVEQLIEQYHLEKKFKVIASVSVRECLEDLSLLDGADTVFLFGVHSHDRNIIVKYCLYRGIKAFLVPRVGDLILSGARKDHLFHLPLLTVGRANSSFEYAALKRLGDILLSLIAAILASPIMLITAICIKCEDHGPIIYKQTRLTKDGKKFEIYKFRSMRTDAEKDGVARLSTGDADDRITKTGRFIRKVRIDELPQLFNIIKGDISIVGPRAERPEIAAEYEKTLPEFALRLQVKAGLTGYAQVYGKYNTTPYDKLLMDLMYIGNASILEDIRIIFATVKILFLPESTEGVAEGQTTAMIKEK